MCNAWLSPVRCAGNTQQHLNTSAQKLLDCLKKYRTESKSDARQM